MQGLLLMLRYSLPHQLSIQIVDFDMEFHVECDVEFDVDIDININVDVDFDRTLHRQ